MAHTIKDLKTRRRAHQRKYTSHRVNSLKQLFSHNRRQMTQYFWIDPILENTITGKNGMSFRIPAGAFEDRWGNQVLETIKVEIIELYKKADIVLADRATTSGNQLLETGGAFYFAARRNNNPLRLITPVQATIPFTNRVNTPEYMSIFAGRNQSGRFNWNPGQNSQATLDVNTTDRTFNISIRQPGWVNCDHYYRLRLQEHFDLRINPNPELTEQEVFLIYRTINTVAKLHRNDAGQFHFPSPIPLPSIIYSLGTENGLFYQNFHPIIQGPKQRKAQKEIRIFETDLPMEHVLQENIQSNLEKQIRFWDKEVTREIQNRYWQLRYQRPRKWRER